MKTKNKSPFGWWVATLIERWESENEETSNLKRRCIAWTNIIILKAKDRDEAYSKAMEYGNLGKDNNYDFVSEKTNKRFKIVFEGLSSLLPIYDKIDKDGTEIFFDEEYVTVGRVKSWIRKKDELEVFNDEE